MWGLVSMTEAWEDADIVHPFGVWVVVSNPTLPRRDVSYERLDHVGDKLSWGRCRGAGNPREFRSAPDLRPVVTMVAETVDTSLRRSMRTPVVLIIFNRPEVTRRVFEVIRAAEPETLYVIADGARHDHEGEQQRCEMARSATEKVDWTSDVRRIYSDSNLGCGRRVSSGLDDVFSDVEEAIVVEDDCLPHPTFFRFCEELLLHYREEQRVVAISGDNFQRGNVRGQGSYYFSRYNHCWGWASWRREWSRYDFRMEDWPSLRDEGWLRSMFRDPRAVRYWSAQFDAVSRGEIDTWDLQWTFACWRRGGLSALPNTNLVSNIGFGADATHCAPGDSGNSLPARHMTFPLIHPETLERDVEADRFTYDTQFHEGRRDRWRRRARSALSQLYPARGARRS